MKRMGSSFKPVTFYMCICVYIYNYVIVEEETEALKVTKFAQGHAANK